MARPGDSELLRALQPPSSSSSRRPATGVPSRNTQTPIPPNSQPQSGSSSSSSRATTSDSSLHASPGSTSPPVIGRKIIDRNRKPCGSCSSSKRKCKLISTSPMLCQRCKSRGLSECPPHISWSDRRTSSTSPTEGYPVGGDNNYLQPNYDPNSMFGMGFDQDELASMSSASSPGLQEGLSPDPNAVGLDVADNFPQALRYAMMSRNPPALPELPQSTSTSFNIISNVVPSCDVCVCRTCHTQFRARYSPYGPQTASSPSGRSNTYPGPYNQYSNTLTNAMNYPPM
ncbi:hypothetical protein SCHPADRAFT_54288 [Schizopora paradoxa]|uniref:Zn(2)-C6 fungal-type domain-containing protein n=1 Tax=Schizopora paradoxa TaxID=27342 RepID=A0A0H2SRH8_9AGAM|nr:hypothetical protein SCHPADRAFT_54288 [Schizopora paradoxa]